MRRTKTSNVDGHVSVTGNGTGDMFPIVIGDNDESINGFQGTVTTHTYPIIVLTVHDKGVVYTYQLNAEVMDVFLTNAQKKALIKKIKLAKMVEKL